MYLKQLDIFGFKSFAHKLDLEFGPGMTCVVGPNGCGKTNVADAIRWVLGEQSAAELRGANMADVIFNGTKQRRRLGMAEVALTIDNSAGYLPTDYTEVVIGRRVFRSGESEYLLNKTPCRLRDINDLFLDTGVGTRTYSLIERKMVDSILSDSTGHRRFMFEEAAGIMKYKIRKRSALNKLEATATDMQRVSDIISEVEKQVRSLKRQLAQARRHRRYTDELRELDIALGRREYAEWQTRKDESAGRISELRRSIGECDDVLSSSEREGMGIRTERHDKEEALGSLEIEIAELDARARSLADGLLVGTERRNASERRVAELDTELTDIRANLSLALARAARLEDRIKEAASRAEERDGELSSMTEGLAEVEKEHHRLKELLDGDKQTRLAGLESSAGLKGELESYRTRLDDLMEEHVVLEAELSENRATLADKEEHILTGLESEKRLRGAAHDAGAAHKQATASLDGGRENLLSARERKTKLEGELDAAEHKRQLLFEIRDGYGGFQDGVRSLLSEEAGSVAGLIGTVADVLAIDQGMDGAIETALGGAVQYVVTRDVESARSAMGHLSRGSLGKATFIPVSELAGVRTERPPDGVLSSDGVVGPASDFVRCDASLGLLPQFLLEGVVIVRDLDTALTLRTRDDARDLAFVTPAGDMVTAAGVMSGGRPGNEEAGLLRRAERLDAAERAVAELAKRLTEARQNEEKAESELAAASEAAEKSEAAAEWAEAQLWDAKRELAELELGKTNLSGGVSRLAANRDALGVRMESTRRDLTALANRLSQLSKGEDELGEKLGELERNFRVAERKRAKVTEEEKQAEIGAAAARVEVTQLKGEHAQLGESVRTARSSIEKKTEEREQHLRTVAELDTRNGADGEVLSGLNTEKSALERDRDKMRDAVRELRTHIEKLDGDTRTSREARDKAQSALHEIELRNTELRSRFEALRERLREEYSADVQELGDLRSEEGEPHFDAPKAKEEIERLKARLRAMGPVNLLALDEYDEESKRLEFLTGQYDDLEKSKESLKAAIDKINGTARDMFLETFELVRQNFITMFQRLFEGGDADLRLADPNDPLDSAIEIVASPREKKLGRLSLLSGGERALTAIALLFAIYLVKPSPFCILDEVDAPLDDANVQRFVRMLKEFSARTQFIIITHNKATMKEADRLYGITMEESGVSKVVSVSLDAAREEVGSEEAVLEAA
ncbi:MAG: chromosome segregation protein SMC [Candidatus Eisenbacteria bacterium]